MNHREGNPLLESDRLDPSMDMYFLFIRLRCEHLTDCPAQPSQAASGYGMVKSGHDIRGQRGHVIADGHPRAVTYTLCIEHRVSCVHRAMFTTHLHDRKAPNTGRTMISHANTVPENSDVSESRFYIISRTPQ